MDKMNSIPNERVCDLVDGHVPDGDHAQDLDAVLTDSHAMQTWHAYHVIGDVLRSAELAPSGNDLAFLQRLEQKLAQEPVRPTNVAALPVAMPVAKHDVPSANASVFRWKMLASVAGFAFVGVLGMNLWTQTGPRGDAQLASQSAPAPRAAASTLVAAETPAGAMLRDPRLDELMAAHRQLGGHSALQVPAGFLRNATYEGPAR
jgi:sigma-E factor negative regulatory protein RseA